MIIAIPPNCPLLPPQTLVPFEFNIAKYNSLLPWRGEGGATLPDPAGCDGSGKLRLLVRLELSLWAVTAATHFWNPSIHRFFARLALGLFLTHFRSILKLSWRRVRRLLYPFQESADLQGYRLGGPQSKNRCAKNRCSIFTKIADFSNQFFAKILRLQRCRSMQIL